MAGKKERAFFVCPRWKEVPGIIPAGTDKTLAAIEAGRPVVRSALRRALVAATHRSGKPLDVDAFIEDSRTGPHRVESRSAAHA